MSFLKRFRKRAYEEEFERELNYHVEELVEANLAAGMSPAEARRQALLEFGGRQQTREEMLDVQRVPVLETVAANLRFGLRLVRKSPTFSLAVVLTLALGIGANSAVFSAIDAILLRPLPFPRGDELMLVRQVNPRFPKVPFASPVRVEDWNRMSSTFQAFAGYYTENASELSGPIPEKLTRAFVSPRFLQVLGVAPVLGRDFTPDEEKADGPNAILISNRLWRRRFNGDPGVIGKTLRFSKTPAIIVGVMPPSFSFPGREVDVWTAIDPYSPYARNRESTWYTVVGRLKPGVAVDRARADLTTVQSRLGAQFPETDSKLTVQITPLKDSTVSESRRSLWLLFGSVTLLLLIACTNISALLLARATEREHEISVRFSLGASRWAVIGQLLTEVFVLALLGALAGLGLAAFGIRAFHLLAGNLPRVDEIALDWRLVAYSLSCALAATFLCGMYPAWRATRGQISGSLAKGGKSQVSARNPMQWALVGVQVALAVTLLVGAGLLLRSFQELGRVSPGFDISHVLTLRVSGSYGETIDMKGVVQRINRTLDRLRTVPGVEAAAVSASMPGVPSQFPLETRIVEGETDPNHKITADSRMISAGYFQTMRIPILAGEGCRSSDDLKYVVVNRSFANTYFGQSPAIGHHLLSQAFGGVNTTAEVRGLAADAREQGINTEPQPTVYWCFSAPMPDPFYLVRTTGDPAAMADTLRRVIHEIEPARSVFDITPLSAQVSDAFAENRLRTLLLSLFALTAVSLACIGVYGTLSYLVSVRRREVGVRLALGALRPQIAARFLLQGLRVCGIGCAAGLLLAAASGRLLSGMLYGVSPYDATTVGGVVLLMLLVAGTAALVPALRAARTDPMTVLREG